MKNKNRRRIMTLTEFHERFPDEESCRAYLEEIRWKDGFTCPDCGCHECCVLSNGSRQCNHCHHQTSLTAGTVMASTHLPLMKWFLSIYLVITDKRGIAAVQLASEVGMTYKTAWYLLRRIRIAMHCRDQKYLLNGVVDMDDSFFGGPQAGSKRGRGTRKAKVFVALSMKGICPSYLKFGVTRNIRKNSVRKFARANIAEGSVIESDGMSSYPRALGDLYDHKPEPYDKHSDRLRWMHVMISNAKAYILGTYHGLPKKYLQSYLDEFTYRFNRRAFGEDLVCHLINAVAQPITSMA